MNTDIQKLRSAIMTAKYLNLSEAAHNLNFTPSAVSKHIKSLEDEMGVQLFDRHSRSGVSLTNDGRVVLPVLQKVITDLDELEGVIRSLSESPTFWIGTPPVFPSRITSAFLSRLEDLSPGLKIQILHHDSRTLIELVRLGRLDAGISTMLGSPADNPEFYSIKDRNLIIEPVVSEEEVVLLNEDHPLSKKDTLRMDDLLSDPDNTYLFINPTPSTVSLRQKLFTNECRKRGIKAKTRTVSLELGLASEVVKRQIAARKNYVAFLPPQKELPPGVVARTCADTVYSSRVVIYYMKNNRSRGLKAFIEGAESIIRKGRID